MLGDALVGECDERGYREELCGAVAGRRESLMKALKAEKKRLTGPE
jgi:hypothetical protein